MMKTMNQSPRCARTSSSVLRYSIVFLLGAAVVAAQSRITKPPAQTNSNRSGKRQHIATLRSSDSPEGSRVALSSDQSLNDYEAYRRGDRFYVKIPAADMRRPEAIRGRAFADVKAQRNGDSTVVSFRLQPGATARVEQRANRLDVVFTVAGGNSAAANAARETQRPAKGPESTRNSNANKRNAAGPPASLANKNSSLANKNSADRSSSSTARNAANSNTTSKSGTEGNLASNSGSKAGATPLPSPIPSPTEKIPTPTPTPAPKSSATTTTSPATQPTPVTTTNQTRQDWLSRMKERLNYWILLAQLNPVPVATGVVVLLILIGLFLFQRRRVKQPRRGRSGPVKSTSTVAAPSVQAASESGSAPVVIPTAAEAAAVAGIAAVAARPRDQTNEVEAATSVPIAAASLAANDGSRRERIARVTEEAGKLMNGGNYDASVIGSADRETRQLVGAELLSAIVGRNVARRENARNAFMKHGYFDDATRDLRIADSENERAAAARRLSFVHDREATPHLVGALDDVSPDVRRTAVEALMDLRDPAAIGPLNSLMQTENDRKVPRTLIKMAIEACATTPPEAVPSVAVPDSSPTVMPEPTSHPLETEREVIEL
jgi:HEAT repeats